jgi:hypothetical protein
VEQVDSFRVEFGGDHSGSGEAETTADVRVAADMDGVFSAAVDGTLGSDDARIAGWQGLVRVVGVPSILSYAASARPVIRVAGPKDGWPPMCQPLRWSSSMSTQTTSRKASEPSKATITSVSLAAMSCLCLSV